MHDRRRAERYPIEVRVEMPTGIGLTRNISGLGVLFQTEVAVEAGDRIDFTLVVPDAGNIRCRGRVIRTTPDGASRFDVAATIERYLLPEESRGEHPTSIVVRELRDKNPEGWEWGE